MKTGVNGSDDGGVGFIKWSFLAAVAVIVIFGAQEKALFNSMNVLQWKGESVFQVPLLNGLVYSVFALALIGIYTILFLLGYHLIRGGGLQLKDDMTAAMIFAAMALLMTYPLIFHFTTHIPGDNQDAKNAFWRNWMMKESVLGLKDPFHTTAVFHPAGTTLLLAAMSFSVGLLSVPLQLLFSTIIAYNVLVLLTLVWCGLGMYKLAEYMTGDRRVALVCGLAYAFAPYNMAHLLGHINIISNEWLPFFTLHLIRAARGEGRRDGLLAGLFFAAIIWTELTFAIYAAIITAIVLAHQLASGGVWRTWRFAQTFALLSAVSVVLISPWLYFAVKEYGSFDYPDRSTESIIHSADLFAYVIPPAINPVVGGIFRMYQDIYTSFVTEKVVYLGWTIIILAGMSLSWQSLIHVKSKAWLWAAIAAVFLVLALGPVLHSMGVQGQWVNGEFQLADGHIPLPYKVVGNLPLIGVTRSPSRFAIVGLMALIVLAGFSLKRLAGQKNGQRILAAAAVLIVLEFMPAPYPVVDMSYRGGWSYLGQQPGQALVYEIPGDGDAEYGQHIHGKDRLLAGSFRIPLSVTQFRDRLGEDVKNLPFPEFADKYGIDYVVLQKGKLDNTADVEMMLTSFYGNPGYSDATLSIYRTNGTTLSPRPLRH
ncbi:MAG: hypothetical protein V1875_06445 [Candidatus Altiarchaeota archaeon]